MDEPVFHVTCKCANPGIGITRWLLILCVISCRSIRFKGKPPVILISFSSLGSKPSIAYTCKRVYIDNEKHNEYLAMVMIANIRKTQWQ